MTLLLSMITFALVGAITPGPVNIITLSTALSAGISRALMVTLGASIAYALVVFIAGTGLVQGLLALGGFEVALLWIGAIYLLYLAWRIAMAPVSSVNAENVSSAAGFWQGAWAQWLNPKAWIVSASGVSLFVLTQESPQWALAMFCQVSLVCGLIGVGFWAAAGHALQRFFAEPARQRLFNRTMALLLCVSVISMLASEYL